MGVKLTIEVTPPLTEADTEVLTGATMTLFALVQGLTTKPEEEEEEGEEEEEKPCGFREYDLVEENYTGRTCISTVGHKGRHRFRDPVPPGMN